MPGRRPKPTVLKLAQGNPGRRPINDAEPETTGAPTMPGHLTPKARKAWESVLPILMAKGLAGDLDAWALERLCSCYAEILEADAAIDVHGLTYECETESGTMVRTRPEVAIRADADRRFKGYLVEFGLTPAARSKVKISGKKDKDPRARFFGPKAAG